MSQQYPECQEEADYYGERPNDSEPEPPMKSTQQRIDEIIKMIGNYEEVLRLMLEALVIEAQREKLQSQLEQLKK